MKTILVSLLVFFSVVAIALQSPAVQTLLTKEITHHLDKVIDGDIKIGKVHLRPFHTILLKDVAILDKEPYINQLGESVDTLFSARYITTKFDLKGLIKGEMAHFDYAKITDGSMCLVTEPIGNDSTRLNLNRIFRLKPSKKEKKEPKDLFEINRVHLKNFRFQMKNYNPLTLAHKAMKKEVAGTIDWTDLDIREIHLKGHDLSMKKGIVSGTVESLSFKEKSGYNLRKISGSTKVGNGKTIIEDLHLQDDWSDLHLPHLTFSYANTKSWSNFEEEVHLDGAIASNTLLDLTSIGYFAGAVKKMSFVSTLEGTVNGWVNNLNIDHLQFHTTDSQVKGLLTGHLSSVTSAGKMKMDVQAHQLTFDTKGLGEFIRSWAPAVQLDLSKFAPGQPLTLNAKVQGLLDDFNVNGALQHEEGKILTDIDIRHVSSPFEPIVIGGKLESENLNLGHLLGVDLLGECSLGSRFIAELGESPALKIDSLQVSKLNALDYDYSGIAANGTYAHNTFNGRVICNDPNLNFLFQGIFTTPSKRVKNLIYRFYANLGYADLQALNIDKRGVSRISFQTNTNFNHVKDGNILGQININNLILEDDKGKHDIGNIEIASHINDDVNRIKLSSRFANGYYIGTEFLDSFVKDLQLITTQKELPALQTTTAHHWKGNQYEADIRFHDCTDILSFLVPGVYIADSTHLHLDIDQFGTLSGQVKSRRLAFKDKYIKGIELNLDNKNNQLQAAMKAKELSVSPILTQSNQIQVTARDNRIALNLQFANESEEKNQGDLHLVSEFERNEQDSLMIRASILPSKVYFQSSLWDLGPADIDIYNHNFKVDQFQLTNQEQIIRIDGGYSRNQIDTLTVRLDKFDLGLANHFMKADLDLQSKVSGYAHIISPSATNFGVLLNMQCDSTYLAEEEVGTLQLKSAWDDIERCFKYMCNNNINGARTLGIRGKFVPKNKTIDATAWLNAFNFAYTKPFLNTVFDDIKGYLSGNVTVKGPFNHLDISGENLRINNGYLVVGFTKVPYYLDGPLIINNNGLYFDKVNIKDNYDERGEATGGILWNHLKDFEMDTHLRFADLEALKTTASDNPSFFGHAFGTGTVNITGPFNGLLIEVNAQTAKKGKIHVPLNNSATSTTSDLLTFKEPEKDIYIDPYELMMNKMETDQKSTNNLGVRLRLNVNPNTQAVIEVDKETGNILNGWGNGYIDMEIRPSDDLFNINGDFNLMGGNYHFGALGIAYRDFTLQNGGTIKFNGDIMESDLDMTALYKTKANIGVLIADENTSMTKRQVNCSIGINGKIKNPRIAFGVEVPDLDPTTQSRVESALSTEDKTQKQFLSLLLSNSFLPDEQSGIVNNNSLLYSNVTEIMANQLSNILQKLDIPVDLGMDYQQSDDGKNAFDVAVSTELFNNRVVVNGTLGSRQYSTGNQTNEFVGDLDIEVKLDKSGAVRLNLFSHSVDQYSSYLDNSQRNGIGITYQHEFNTFKEFFNDLFKSRKKKEAERKALQNVIQNEPKNKIVISPVKKKK